MGDLSALTEQERVALEAQRRDVERFHLVVGSLVIGGGSVLALYALFWMIFSIHLALRYG